MPVEYKFQPETYTCQSIQAIELSDSAVTSQLTFGCMTSGILEGKKVITKNWSS